MSPKTPASSGLDWVPTREAASSIAVWSAPDFGGQPREARIYRSERWPMIDDSLDSRIPKSSTIFVAFSANSHHIASCCIDLLAMKIL